MKKIACLVLLGVLRVAPASAWHDETHLAIARAAGYGKYYNVAGPDMIKVKADALESGNHYFNNSSFKNVTPDMVLLQAPKYDIAGDEEGHLYGAIIASLGNYIRLLEGNKYAEYHFAFAAHYLGDLSNPLHNTPYDDFNRQRHSANDGVIEAEALNNLADIQSRMYEIRLQEGNCIADLAKEIARVANITRALGDAIRQEGGRNMTKEEAYTQAGHSASLIKAALGCVRRRNLESRR